LVFDSLPPLLLHPILAAIGWEGGGGGTLNG
jgi:hypothetical protein